MNYSDENFELLKPYEPYFLTAVRSSWARNIGSTMLESLRRIFEETSGHPYPLRGSCGTCQLHLLQDAGKLYFQDKEEREALARAAARVDEVPASEEKSIAPKKVAVKMPRTRKKPLPKQ